MQLRDPRAPKSKDGRPDSAVYVRGDRVEVQADGTFSHPAIDEQWARGYAERNDATVSEVLIDKADSDDAEADTGALVNADDKSDKLLIDQGVCPWCSDYEGDHVGQHASSAHPDEWDEYKAD